MSLELARTVADAVLYEGYLLYPYRSTSSKNQSRWQWGVLGPPGAAAASLGEESSMSTQCVLRSGPVGQVSVHLRFLQLQTRSVERATDDAECFEPVAELTLGARTWLTWDEAVEHEIELGPCPLGALAENDQALPVDVAGGEGVELLRDDDGTIVGRVIRRRWPLKAVVSLGASPVDGLVRLSLCVENVAAETPTDKKQAIRSSLIGAHLLVRAQDADFVSLLEPSDDAVEAVAGCTSRRCWPVLAGEPGQTDVVLASPIILYDYPEVAEQSAGELFDSTEIDEILTLRVMTLTDEEKAAARATDPRAAAIIDRCDEMSPTSMQALHGVLRDPHAGMGATSLDDIGSLDEVPDAPGTPMNLPDLDEVPTYSTIADLRNVDPPSFDTGGAPWWDPAADASVQPDVDSVLINGVPVAKDSIVCIHPSRRADAQDIFFAGQNARVTAVLCDVDGQVHVAVVLVDDPAADMHEWYGRYLYFTPEELEPLGYKATGTTSDQREESRS